MPGTIFSIPPWGRSNSLGLVCIFILVFVIISDGFVLAIRFTCKLRVERRLRLVFLWGRIDHFSNILADCVNVSECWIYKILARLLLTCSFLIHVCFEATITWAIPAVALSSCCPLQPDLWPLALTFDFDIDEPALQIPRKMQLCLTICETEGDHRNWLWNNGRLSVLRSGSWNLKSNVYTNTKSALLCC